MLQPCFVAFEPAPSRKSIVSRHNPSSLLRSPHHRHRRSNEAALWRRAEANASSFGFRDERNAQHCSRTDYQVMMGSPPPERRSWSKSGPSDSDKSLGTAYPSLSAALLLYCGVAQAPQGDEYPSRGRALGCYDFLPVARH